MLLGLGFFLPLLPVLIIYFIKLRKHPGSGLVLLLILSFQLIIMVILWIIFIEDIPSAAAIIMPGVIAIYHGTNIVISLLCCPIFYFICARPEKWKKKIAVTIIIYILILILLCMRTILTLAGFGTNIELYGKVTNIDGSPIKNAAIYFSNCPYIKDNPEITNEDGMFKVIATCTSYLIVKKIHNPETNSNCQSRFKRFRDHRDELIVFDRGNGKEYPRSRPRWGNYGKDNPFVFACMWTKPKLIIKKKISLHLENKDSRYTLNLHAEKYKDVINKNGEIEIKYNFRKEVITISAVNGGVQGAKRKAYIDIAPKGGYKNRIEYNLSKNSSANKHISMFFNINNTYGYMEFSHQFIRKHNVLKIAYIFNPDGGVNLITDKVYSW